MTNTFDDYLRAVKQHYEVAKNGVYACFLLHPSPAQLRNFCLLLLENDLSKSDEEVFKVFFQVTASAALKKGISNFDVEKFKAVGNFLKGKSEKTNAVSLNLIAVLVDYQPRPFHKYLKGNENLATNIFREDREAIQEEEAFVAVTNPFLAKANATNKGVCLKKWGSISLVLLIVLGATYIVGHEFFSKKECMQWQEDHYERVDCITEAQGIGLLTDKVPVNESEINLKKIEVNKQTVFFRNGKPLVWYSKRNGEISYFNSHGIHPETGRPLKPITEYMIDKYIKNERNP